MNYTAEQALADLRTLVEAIPEEIQGEATSEASNRLYGFITSEDDQS